MVWGALSSGCKLDLAFVSCRMDSEEYQTTLREHLLPFLSGRRRWSYVFQQDNAAVHVSHSTMTWLRSNNIQVLHWPACSPDLNTIENLWGILVRKIYANNRQFYNVEELRNAILQAWEDIDPAMLVNLAASMPRRLLEVGTKHGGPIDH
ncbi:hypothetical protein ANCCAN_26853 [Ancylostoma caninum]|uniref:Tc1-like transposase DDE domain-containing protein n=1 Tax=Ancylostoma caninum TaxID=29170 RepID=A0A368F5R7_ANCCA|nr:hypothetical protein ANCCAN_26853 [Ancylostoma caninum]